MSKGRIRARLWGLAVAVALFGAGMIAGLGLGGVLRSTGPGPAPPFLLEEALVHIELSPEQSMEIDGVLDRYGRTTRTTMESLGERLEASVDSARLEIRGLLLPSQLERFDSLLVDQERQMRSRVRMRGPAPRPDSSSQQR